MNHLYKIFCPLIVLAALCSCNRKAFEPVEEIVFIQDAGIEEEGRTCAPVMPSI